MTWEDAGFKDEASYNTFVALQNAEKEAAIATAKANADAEFKARIEIEKATAIAAESARLKGIHLTEIENLKKQKDGVAEVETPELREERFGTELGKLESTLGDADWDKVDAEIKKLSPEQQKLVKNTKEGRYAFIKSIASPQSEEPESLRPKPVEKRLSVSEQIAEGIAKSRGQQRGIPRRTGHGLGSAPQNNNVDAPIVQRIPKSGSLTDLRPLTT
jgi:hypothetical protein